MLLSCVNARQLKSTPDKPPSNSPIYVVSTDPQIISKHSDIYQPAFVDFLRYLIVSAGEKDPYE